MVVVARAEGKSENLTGDHVGGRKAKAGHRNTSPRPKASPREDNPTLTTYAKFKAWWRKKTRKEKLAQLGVQEKHLNEIIRKNFKEVEDSLLNISTSD